VVEHFGVLKAITLNNCTCRCICEWQTTSSNSSH